MKINLNINPDIFLSTFRPYIEDYTNRYEVYYGGRGSGKTYFIIQKLLLKGLKEKRMILLMRKETNKLRDSVWKELLSSIDNFGLTEYFTFNRSEYRATCTINGTEFKCLGLDESEKIKGFADCSDVFIDEVTAFSQEDYELIDGTLRSSKYNLPLLLIVSFNPVSKANFVYRYFGFEEGITPPNTLIHKSTFLDNDRLDKSYAERMERLKDINPNRYKIEALGLFVSLDKLIYNNWRVEEFDHRSLPGKLCIGLDFGFTNDPTAIVASIFDEDEKKIYIFDEFYETNKTNDQIALILTYKGFSKSDIIADSAEPKSIEEIKKLGILRIKPSVKGKDSIMSGIQKIQQYEIIVKPSCVNMITELENYSFKREKSSGEYINEAEDKYNHLCDALRYSILALQKNTKLRSIDLSGTGL